MAAGAVAIACSSASESEYASWREAAQREIDLYGISPSYVATRMEGRELDTHGGGRTWVDWLLIAGAVFIFAALGAMARVPQMEIRMEWLAALSLAMLVVLVAGGLALWRITKFS